MTYRIRASRRLQILGVAALLTLAAGIALAADDAKPAAALPEAKLLAAYKVTAIRLIPSELVFSSASDYRKMLVLGKTDQANEIDLTRTAKLTPAGDCVRFDEDGYLHPVKDGETRIAVSAGGLKAEMPVTVRDLEKPRPVSFVRDVEPILNKVGCTAGTCHGAAKGRTASSCRCAAMIRSLTTTA